MNRYVKKNFTSLYQTTIGTRSIIQEHNFKAKLFPLMIHIVSSYKFGIRQAKKALDLS